MMLAMYFSILILPFLKITLQFFSFLMLEETSALHSLYSKLSKKTDVYRS